jgi:hypothetical protein
MAEIDVEARASNGQPILTPCEHDGKQSGLHCEPGTPGPLRTTDSEPCGWYPWHRRRNGLPEAAGPGRVRRPGQHDAPESSPDHRGIVTVRRA